MPGSLTHSSSFPRMCTWRRCVLVALLLPLVNIFAGRVRNLYKLCGHAVNLPDEEIKCTSATCKFSPAHPKECTPPRCTATCWQYRRFPEQYSPHLDKACPQCTTNRK